MLHRRLFIILACLALVLLVEAEWALAVVPAGFEDVQVTKLSAPTSVRFTPDGRMLITAKDGTLRVFQGGTQTTALDISNVVCSDQERGLGGLAVDPAFQSNHFIYLYYTYKSTSACGYGTTNIPVNRLSRFVLGDNNVVDKATETPLLDNIPNSDGIHNAGDLHFGKDGYLYVSVGDGGCDYAGDSGCGSQNDASRDPNVLLGKILRITKDGGIPPTNPYLGTDSRRCALTGRTTVGLRCQETYASGLRNPWRMAFDPNATGTRFFTNDTGQNTWEEVNLGQAAADYGWNVREGPCVRGSTTNCGPPPAGMTNPIWSYPHSSGCTGITGAAFIPNGIWPQAYDNGYLYGDFVCGKIVRLTPQAGGALAATDFVTGLGVNSVTSMTFGPYGTTQALYYLNFLNGGEVRRVAFTGTANRSPTAVAAANPTSGPAPLAVMFDGSASTDPDRDTLTYDWDFGDGTAHGAGATPSHTYTTPGSFTVTLRVRDGRGGEGVATLRIDAGNDPPAPTITSPTTDKRFRVGETITLTGSATDPQDGPLPDSSLSWRVIKHHDTHIHPALDPTTGNNIPIVMPVPEDLASTTTTYVEIQLTATDSKGLSNTVTQSLLPNIVDVNVDTVPTGLRIDLNQTPFTAPYVLKSWEGYRVDVSAPNQTDSTGQFYAFDSWSDGDAQAHTITTPASPLSLTANFEPQVATELTFPADADARVEELNPTTNFGASNYLRVDGGPDPDVQSYLRFTVSGVSGTVLSAKLRLYSYNVSVDGPAAYSTSNSWSETGTGGITWSNKPPPQGAPIDDKGAVAADSFVDYDLTRAVNENGTYSFVLAGTSADGVYFYSRSGVTPPQLILDVAPASYARPKSATPITTSLVPAYRACASPDARHGGALDQGSCRSPAQASSLLTFGTLDSNGASPNMTGSARVDVCPVPGCAAPDVRIMTTLSDVRCAAAFASCGAANTRGGSDYGGELEGRLALRITDRYNGPSLGEAATVQDTALSVTVGCTETTSDATKGSSCRVDTTANAVVPGAVASGKHADVELGQVEIYDGGTDGDAATTADDGLLAVQGLYVP